MLDSKKKNIVYINKDERPSRFLVDLNKFLGEDDSAKKLSWKSRITKLFSQITQPNRKTTIKNFRHKLADNTANFSAQNKKNISSDIFSAKTESRQLFFNKKESIKKWYLSHQFNRLTFFPLIKLLVLIIIKVIKLFYQLCYRIGWAVVFIVRFFGLIVSFTFKLIGKIVKIIFLQSIKRLIFKKAGKHLPKSKNKIVEDEAAFLLGDDSEASSGNRRLGIIRQTIKRVFTRDKQDVEKVRKADSKEFDRLVYGEKEAEEDLLPITKTFSLKPVMVFASLLLILVLPIKALTYYKNLTDLRGRVLGASETAVSEMIAASELAAQFDFQQANQGFNKASDNFLAAQNEISEVSSLLTVLGSIIPNQDIKLAANAKLILEAGQLGAELGHHLSNALDNLFEESQPDVKDFLNNFYLYSQQASQCAQELKIKIEAINSRDLPDAYKKDFLVLSEKVDLVATGLNELVEILDKARIFLGFESDRRYLLIFQNNAELRASGGFVGSFALVDFRNGSIKNLEAPGGGSYDTEAGLLERIIAPEPLHLVNPLWHFWDANWWPDWPTSARKLQWFYEKSDGPTVDGVIGITPTLVERILDVIGPIDMSEDYGVVIDADNFWETTQGFAEQKEDITNKPKKIIGDLIRKINDELPKRLNKDNFIGLAKAMEESLGEKHILLYFNDSQLQRKVEELGWGGKVRQTNQDYLMVVNTNIAGGKSDRKIKEIINHTVEVSAGGSIINTVKIKRIHTGIKNEKFTGVRNVNWMRIYVPQGSQLIEAQGFVKPAVEFFEKPEENWIKDPDVSLSEEMAVTDVPSGTKIYNEFGKTVFANWSMVDPGETVTVYLKYRLPFKLEEVVEPENFINRMENILNPVKKQLVPYALFAQKQPGSLGSDFTSSLKLPANFKIFWQYPPSLPTLSDGWLIQDKLEVDKFWAVFIEM